MEVSSLPVVVIKYWGDISKSERDAEPLSLVVYNVAEAVLGDRFS